MWVMCMYRHSIPSAVSSIVMDHMMMMMMMIMMMVMIMMIIIITIIILPRQLVSVRMPAHMSGHL